MASSQMTSKCGKNKKVAHEAIAECHCCSFYQSFARENSLSSCEKANLLVFIALQVISHVNTSYDPSASKRTVQGSKVCA